MQISVTALISLACLLGLAIADYGYGGGASYVPVYPGYGGAGGAGKAGGFGNGGLLAMIGFLFLIMLLFRGNTGGQNTITFVNNTR